MALNRPPHRREPGAAFMPELTAEILDAAALLVAVLCWGAVLFPAAVFWRLYTQRAPS